MKRFLLSACVAALLPTVALAQVTVNPNAKVDPKNNKVGRPVVEKPKQKLMSRDELRACLVQLNKSDTEAADIKAAQQANTAERAELIKAKDLLAQQGEALTAQATELKAERDELLKTQEELKVQIPKMEKAEAEKLVKDYHARAAATDAKIEGYNSSKLKYSEEGKAFDAKIEAHNAANKALAERTETHLDAVEDWKEDCSKKAYDENDEIAIKKELGLK